MIDIQQVLCSDGAAIVLLIMILQSSSKVLNHKLFDHKLMNQMIVVAILACSIESLSFLLNGIPGHTHHIILNVVSALQYIINSLFAYIWIIYADYKLFADMDRIKNKRFVLLAIPGAFNIICSFINMFTPIFFTVDDTNNYTRTSLYFIPNIIIFFYLAYGTILIYKYRSKVGKYLFLPVIFFMIPVLGGVILDFIFYGIAVKQMGVAIGLTSLYINVQKEISCIEPLSGLRTRQYMINSLYKEMSSTSEKKVVGVLLDIDKFKSINDTYGHLAGDHAIQSFGFILRSAVFKNDMAVRFAGDEFMILHRLNKEEEIHELLENVQQATNKFNESKDKPYTIRFSAGYSILDKKNDTIDTFLDRVDQAMYEEKRKRQNK